MWPTVISDPGRDVSAPRRQAFFWVNFRLPFGAVFGGSRPADRRVDQPLRELLGGTYFPILAGVPVRFDRSGDSGST